MKTTMKATVAAAGALALQACATTYTNDAFADYQAKHETVAVLPFEVRIDRRNLKGQADEAALTAAEKEEAFLFQQQLATQLLNRQQKGRYTVAFMDVDRTNVMLERAGVTYETLPRYTKDEIGEMLDVDAILSGDIKRAKPMQDGAATAATVFGVLGGGTWGTTNQVVVNLTLHDAETGNLLWAYDHQQQGGVGSTPDRLAKNLMKNVASKFPYKQD